MKRVKKIIMIFFVVIIAIIATAFLFIQTPWAKDILKNQIVGIANKEINGTLGIEKINGNFFSKIEISKISLSDENNDTIAKIEKLGLKYSIIDILVGRITVNDFYIVAPQINLSQQDSVWNFEKLIVPDTTKVDTTISEPFNFKLSVLIDKIRLENGNINIVANDTIIPQSIENINISISAYYDTKNLLAKLNRFSFKTKKPDVELKNLTFAINYDFKKWELDKFLLSTAKNDITIKAIFEDFENLYLGVNWNNIEFSEFEYFLPPTKIIAKPNFNFTLENNNSFAEIKTEISYNKSHIKIFGNILNFENFIENNPKKEIKTELTININNAKPNDWIVLDKLNAIANCDIEIYSGDILNNQSPIFITGNINNSSYEKFIIESSDIEISYIPEMILSKININSNVGDIVANANVSKLEKKQKIDANILIENVILNKILENQLENSIINSTIKADGFIENDSIIDINFLIGSNNLTAEHIHFDTLNISGNYKNDLILINEIVISNNSFTANAKASLKENNYIDATLNLNLKNIDEFSHYVEQQINWESINLNFSTNGSLDTLNINAQTKINKIEVDSLVFAEKINFATKGKIIKNNPFIDGKIDIFNISNNDIQIDTTNIIFAIADSLWNIALQTTVLENKIQTKIAGNLTNFNSIEVENLEIYNENNSFELNEKSIINYSDTLIFVDKFNITDKKNNEFSWNSNLFISNDKIDAYSAIKNLNLEILNNYHLVDEHIAGLLNFDINITKNFDDIKIYANSNIDKINYENILIEKVNAIFGYGDNIFDSKISVLSNKNDSLILTAKAPFSISYNDSLHFSWNKDFEAKLFSKELLLNNFFTNTKKIKQPEAILNMDFDAFGNVDKPQFKGYLNIEKGTLPFPKFGIDYKDIKLRLRAENNIINLDSLYIKQKGWLLTKGVVELSNKEFGKLNSLDFSLKSDNFQLAKHNNYDALISSDITLNHNDIETKYGGVLQVLRSSFNIDALTDFGGAKSLETPLLIQALEENRDSTTIEINKNIEIPKSEENEFLRNLKGSLKVEIPRNFWIKSDDMQMELYGDVDVIKNSTFFEIFGSLGVHRGFYTFYGKKMVIDEGEFTFTGGENFNPALHLNALYTFRTPEREKKVLSLNVGGDLAEPEITFSLDKVDIPEADAIAYILFGQPFDQLNHDSQSGVNDAIASRLFSNMIASQLSKTLGKTLNLDLIEVDPTDNWQNTTFTVGKYLTNDLFVTYQRSFGESDDNEISKETISLEYEITKRLSLRLLKGSVKESGVDLIIKVEK